MAFVAWEQSLRRYYRLTYLLINLFFHHRNTCIHYLLIYLPIYLYPYSDTSYPCGIGILQSLRRNFTDGIWQKNPTELVGVWELVDVAGQV